MHSAFLKNNSNKIHNHSSLVAVKYQRLFIKDKLVWLVHILLKQRVVDFTTAGIELRKPHAV